MNHSSPKYSNRRVMLTALVFAAALALPACLPGQNAGTDDADVRDLLNRARTVYEGLGSMQAQFDQTIEIPLLGRRRDGTGTWYQKGRGRFKMDFSDPAGDVIVADGNHLWLYYPSTHPGQVIRSAIEANVTGAGMVDLQGRIFQEADSAYVPVLEGSEDVTGHATWLITLTPKGESPYQRVRVWVDQDSFLVRRFEIVEENETIRTVVLRELKPNETIPNSVFEFSPPEGTDVFEG
jgi:outer membrane lipoprotein carrier protein